MDVVDTCNESEGQQNFQQAWAPTNGRFRFLEQFYGGIATVFPNTASVEYGFSVLGWENDEYGSCLTEFSLEGIMHCK